TLQAALPRCRIAYVGQPSVAVPRAASVAGASVADWVRAMGGKIVARGENISEISLAATPVTDGLVEKLARLSDLEKLNLNGTEIGDAGLAHLSGLTHLRDLSLNNT